MKARHSPSKKRYGPLVSISAYGAALVEAAYAAEGLSRVYIRTPALDHAQPPAHGQGLLELAELVRCTSVSRNNSLSDALPGCANTRHSVGLPGTAK